MTVIQRIALGVVCSSVIVVVAGGSAHAEPIGDPNNSTTSVGPIAAGQTVSQGSAGFNRSGTQSEADSRTNQGVTGTTLPPPGGSGGSNLTYQPIQNGVAPGGGSAALLVACPPGNTPYSVFDPTGTLIGIVCVSNQNPPAGPLPAPLQLAQQASAQQPWPSLQVGVNPGTGLTGLASWFWLGGNPQMPDATASAGPLTVTVHASLIDVVWDFGDGSGVSSGTDLGRAYPAQSSIQHVYQTDTFGRPGGYSCNALVRYRVTYSLNGGPFAELGVKAQPYSVSYQVNQLQPQAVSVP
jgi:hypothetical protein